MAPSPSSLPPAFASPAAQRQRYGNAFVEKCLELGSSLYGGENNQGDDDSGTYLAVWIQHDPPGDVLQKCSSCHALRIHRFGMCQCRECGWQSTVCLADEELELSQDNNWETCAHLWAIHSDNEVCFTGCGRIKEFGENFAETAILFSDQALVAEDSLSNFFPVAVQVQRLPQYRGVTTAEAARAHSYADSYVLVYSQQRTWMWIPNNYPPRTPWFDTPRTLLRIPDQGLNPSLLALTNHGAPQQHGGMECDVWSLRAGLSHIKPLLDQLADATLDRPIPRYQMIIDPNQFVRKRQRDGVTVWVPCEFDISQDGNNVHLVGGDRAHWMDVNTIRSVTEPVLQASLPLLARLKKPHLLLQGQRLQVVVKAQRIELPASRSGDEEKEYIGLWHLDGEHENVVAVVLYYYHVDGALQGGKMEFLDKRPMDLLGAGDAGDNHRDFHRQSLRRALRNPLTKDGATTAIPNCTVPIQTGTLLVFSNYQMVHRVLRMINTRTDRPASRDFVALFILNPAAEPLVPARCHLARPYLYERLLRGIVPRCKQENQSQEQEETEIQLTMDAIQLILEFHGSRPSVEARRRARNLLLHSQLQPRGRIGGSMGQIVSTGNGCYTMIGWLNHMLKDDNAEIWETAFVAPDKRASALNKAPKEINRGLSEILSVPSSQLSEDNTSGNIEGFELSSEDEDEEEEE